MPRTRPQSLLLALAVAALLGTCGLTYAHRHHVRQLVANGQWRGPSSVEDVRARYEVAVVQRLGPELDRAGVAWPPKSMTLLAFKREQRVELWLGNGSHERRVKTYPVLAASGIGGPKTTRGDRQVPEGVYGLPALNPNSSFHLSIRVDYPNAEDHQVLSGDLGGDIFVHGRAVSIGCLAMGDPAIEELFVVASRVVAQRRRILIAPYDFRVHPANPPGEERRWVLRRYGQLRRELDRYRNL